MAEMAEGYRGYVRACASEQNAPVPEHLRHRPDPGD